MNEPELVEREGGGWLALGQAVPAISVAVEGKDEREARAAFAEAAVRWQELVLAAEQRQAT